MVSSQKIDPRRLDQQYKPFSSFAEWMQRTSVDTERWERQSTIHKALHDQPRSVLERARGIATRAAAVDTGAIEGLYEVDRGFTFTVAFETAAWEAALAARGPEFRAYFESHLRAYDYVLDFATRAQPLAEAFIRTLHEQIVASQETYQVVTEVGPQNHPLPKGQYKVHPNHVTKTDGATHSYAPVDMTPAEMHRLLNELRSEQFQKAHVIQQAAYAHYAFVAIHPFADGNGRVARALASVFTYRSDSIPLLILMEHRAGYYAALAAADEGRFQPFTDFIFARGLESIQLVDESVKTATAPTPTDVAARLKALYINPSGYTHPQTDQAGYALLEAVESELNKLAAALAGDHLSFAANRGGPYIIVNRPAQFRALLNGDVQVALILTTTAPADARLQINFLVSLPRISNKDDDIVLAAQEVEDALLLPISGCLPHLSAGVQMRLEMFVERVLGQGLTRLTAAAEQRLKKQTGKR